MESSPTLKSLDFFVKKRKNSFQKVDPSKIRAKLVRLSEGLNMEHVNIDDVVHKVVTGLYDNMTSDKIAELIAETCAYLVYCLLFQSLTHFHYSWLAARVAVEKLHKNTKSTLKQVATLLYNCKNKRDEEAPLLADDVYDIIMKHHEVIEREIDYKKDFNYDYFGFKTLDRAYLLKINN